MASAHAEFIGTAAEGVPPSLLLTVGGNPGVQVGSVVLPGIVLHYSVR